MYVVTFRVKGRVENYLYECVRASLGGYLYRNAKLLCERLYILDYGNILKATTFWVPFAGDRTEGKLQLAITYKRLV